MLGWLVELTQMNMMTIGISGFWCLWPYDKNWFSNLEQIPGSKTVKAATDYNVTAYKRGDIYLKVLVNGEIKGIVMIPLYDSKLAANLTSIRKLTGLGFRLEQNNDYCHVINKKNN